MLHTEVLKASLGTVFFLLWFERNYAVNLNKVHCSIYEKDLHCSVAFKVEVDLLLFYVVNLRSMSVLYVENMEWNMHAFAVKFN